MEQKVDTPVVEEKKVEEKVEEQPENKGKKTPSKSAKKSTKKTTTKKESPKKSESKKTATEKLLKSIGFDKEDIRNKEKLTDLRQKLKNQKMK